MEEKKTQGSNSFRSFFGFRYTIHPILRRKIAGFTLIELLVVMGVITVLSAATLTAINPDNQLKKARDSERKVDLSSIQRGLEVYFLDANNSRYPPEVNGKIEGIEWGQSWEPHLNNLPSDPLAPSQNYLYESDEGGTYYRLFARLERCDDEMILPDIDCETAEYNYSVTSAGLIAAGLPTSTPSPTPVGFPTPTPIPFNCITNPSSGSSPTTVGALTLVPTYESVSIYANFSGDTDGDNNACLQYRKVGDPEWITGMALTPDRRNDVFYQGQTFTNTYKNQWRGSILLAEPDTQYEVKVTFTDPNGVSGTNPVLATTGTWIETALTPSNGTSYYVAKTGNDTNTGTEASPWLTIQKAASTVNPGDIVYVKTGTYAENIAITRSGSSNNYVTFRNFGSDTATIDPPKPTSEPCSLTPEGNTTSACRSNVGIVINASYIRIKGFRIVDSFGAIHIGNNSESIIIENNYATDFEGGYAVKIGSAPTSYSGPSNAKKVTVQNNIFEPSGEPTDQDYGTVSSHNNQGNHVFRGNTIDFKYSGNNSHGEDCFSAIENGQYSNNYKDTDIYNNICIGSTDDSIEADGSDVITRIWGNTIYNGNLALSLGTAQVGPVYYFRNIVYDLKYHWTSCVGIKEGRSGDAFVYIYHNTFYLTDPTNTCVSTTIIADSADTPANKNIVMRNNVFYFDHNTGTARYTRITDNNYGGLDLNYNLMYDGNGGEFARYIGSNSYNSLSAFRAATGMELNGIQAQPTFVNEGAKDFRLAPGSPGVNAGVVLPGFNDTYSGWQANGLPDMGAYEQ